MLHSYTSDITVRFRELFLFLVSILRWATTHLNILNDVCVSVQSVDTKLPIDAVFQSLEKANIKSTKEYVAEMKD